MSFIPSAQQQAFFTWIKDDTGSDGVFDMTGMTLSETRKGGWSEIGVYIGEASFRSLLAVITHPCSGADWFVYWANNRPRSRYKSRKAALEAVGYVSA
jgi:hypothetical protein